MLLPHLTPPLFPYTTLFRSTSGSSAAACTNSITGMNESYGRCSSTSLRRMIEYMSSEVASCAGMRPLNGRSEEHTSELQSLRHLVCRLLLEKKKKDKDTQTD